ncbi:MAG: YihY family inner membrane protein, partial [Burkholderiaceae bacterium]|nr:YihY family inner membrane protein [Burkholderiaceae bacterium]
MFNPAQTIRRARQERLLQMAGSLTFTSLLSLVPFLAVSFALFTRFHWFSPLGAVLETKVLTSLLPPELAHTVIRYLHRFAANAHQLSWLGSLWLLVTAIALLLTVENAFNQIWQVRRRRPFVRRVGLYLAALAIGPSVLAASLWASACLIGLSVGWLAPVSGWATFLLGSGPVVLNAMGLACLYRFLPNARVRWRDALLSGVVAS